MVLYFFCLMFVIKGVPAGSDLPGDVPSYSRVPLGCSRSGACFSKVPIALRPQKAVLCLHSRLRFQTLILKII